MKKILLFAVVATLFAACTQEVVVDVTNPTIADNTPETLVVGFEGDDTRIQLNEAQKTVWTKGDQVSVFYRSNANQLWKYTGETGARTANLKRVDAGTATRDMDRVVVVYPYNEDYYINPSTFNVQASLPATQHYLANSYGLDGNIMISSGEYNDVTLKNVCGWLKLQLTGNGEVVKSITFKGNNGEQVAGELYINSADATSVLASDMGNIAEDEGENATGGAGANLSFDDVVLNEVTLDCGEGITLGSEATAFYIALPPQTFTQGFKVEVTCADNIKMVKSSTKEFTIERNYIQPMATLEFTPSVPNNQIWYTSSDGNIVEPYRADLFGTRIISNTYNDGKGIITFQSDVKKVGQYAFEDCTNLTSITLPDSVTTIDYGAFYGCSSLTNAIIGNSVTSIEQYTFRDCSSLISMTIPDSVTYIAYGAFSNCSNLTSVIIGNGVKTIGVYAFSECSSLTSVTIGNSVTTIDENAFYDCFSLTHIYIYNIAAWCNISFYDFESNPLYRGANLYLNNELVTNLTIPDSITTINRLAFRNCKSITSITIPDSVTYIDYSAFNGCSNLTNVYISDVAAWCNISFFHFDSNPLNYGANLYINNELVTDLTIPDSVTTIGYYTFYNCDSLTQVTIPNSVTTIGNDAFYDCDSLTQVTIPNSVTTIGNNAFYDCDSLTQVTIPNCINSIGGRVFENCSNLKYVYCKAIIPPALDSRVFYYNASDRKIYVPMESVDAYKSAENWSYYASAIVGYNF